MYQISSEADSGKVEQGGRDAADFHCNLVKNRLRRWIIRCNIEHIGASLSRRSDVDEGCDAAADDKDRDGACKAPAA